MTLHLTFIVPINVFVLFYTIISSLHAILNIIVLLFFWTSCQQSCLVPVLAFSAFSLRSFEILPLHG